MPRRMRCRRVYIERRAECTGSRRYRRHLNRGIWPTPSTAMLRGASTFVRRLFRPYVQPQPTTCSAIDRYGSCRIDFTHRRSQAPTPAATTGHRRVGMDSAPAPRTARDVHAHSRAPRAAAARHHGPSRRPAAPSTPKDHITSIPSAGAATRPRPPPSRASTRPPLRFFASSLMTLTVGGEATLTHLLRSASGGGRAHSQAPISPQPVAAWMCMGRKAEHESDSLDVRCVCDCECVRESFFPYTVRCNGTRTDVLCYVGSSSDLTPLPVGNNVWFRISLQNAARDPPQSPPPCVPHCGPAPIRDPRRRCVSCRTRPRLLRLRCTRLFYY